MALLSIIWTLSILTGTKMWMEWSTGLLLRTLRQLEERLGASVSPGPAFGWADAAILPFIRQFANTDREWFDSAPYPCLQRCLKEGLESDLFLSVMKKHKAREPSELGFAFELLKPDESGRGIGFTECRTADWVHSAYKSADSDGQGKAGWDATGYFLSHLSGFTDRYSTGESSGGMSL